MDREPPQDVIVIIPGMLGSVLNRADGSVAWGSAGMLASLPSLGLGLRIEQALVATELLADRAIVPGFWKADGYTRLHQFLYDRLRENDNRLLLTFPYDWRQSNEQSASCLRRFVHDQLGAWRDVGHPQAKVTLVAHSMGGLVARWYLDVLGDDLFGDGPTTSRLITIGTPYRGAVKALGVLVNGVVVPVLSWSTRFTASMSDAVRSMPSVYELLPRYRALAGGDGLVKLAGSVATELLDPDCYAAACAFHERLEAVPKQRANDRRLPTYDIHAVVSVLQPTDQYASLAGDRVELAQTYNGENHRGDGTVPRQSVSPPEWRNESAAAFHSQKHAHLQNTDTACHQIHGIVTTGDDWRDMAPAVMKLSMDAAEVIAEGDDYRCSVGLEGEVDEDAVLVATVEGDAGALRSVRLKPDGHRRRTTQLQGLPAGLWRVTVAGPAYVEPVSDLLLVAGAPPSDPSV